MCSPVFLPMIVQGVGQYQAARLQRDIAERNEAIAEMLAVDARRRGDAQEQQQRRAIARLIGSQRATIGASGVAVGFGSPASVLEDNATLAELSVLTIRNNAAREAFGFRAQQLAFAGQASQARQQQFMSILSTGADAFGTGLRVSQRGQ